MLHFDELKNFCNTTAKGDVRDQMALVNKLFAMAA